MHASSVNSPRIDLRQVADVVQWTVNW